MAGGGEQQQAHRAGVYKQKNKGHKHGKHRTKGEIERENKGRASVMVLTKKQRKDQKRMDRRHKANQLRRNKKDLVLTQKRSLGTRDGPPHLVAVVALHAGVDTQAVTQLLRAEGAGGKVRTEGGVMGDSDSFGLLLPRFKQRFVFISPSTADLYSLLDVAKVADSLLFVLDSKVGWDSYGDYCLSCLFAQGLSSHVLVCQGMSTIAVKKQAESRRGLLRLAETRFPGARLFPLDSEMDSSLLLRHLGGQKQQRLGFRSRRSHILAQRVSYAPGSTEGHMGGTATGAGTLCVSGYVRGRPLQVNRLVHIVGHGDFQLSQIDTASDPLPLIFSSSCPAKGDREMQDEGQETAVRVLMEADPNLRESLLTEAEVDPMDGEQTWPTDTELLEAEEARKSKRVIKVPKGTSSYQAAWILEDEEEENEEEDDESDDDGGLMEEGMEGEEEDGDSQGAGSGCASEDEEEEEELEEEDVVSSSGRGQAEQRYDEHMDETDEGEGLQRYREARNNEMFPDEVDTPLDVPAKIRFQRYRGLKSFRSSPWDPLENLPPDYSRIFQFQNFDRTRRRILAEEAQAEEGAMVGWYVTLHIVDVPLSVMESFQAGRPLVLVSLLPHEQKMSVMHMVVRHHPSCTEPIKSKEELVFQCGFRRFRASPIFSQHTSADKHKMEPDLVATGCLLGCDPQRVTLKRIVLSGHPFKINRRSAVVRYMFFTREDILWFKPVELRTKCGRRGHIKEALGTHGHMKCVFESQLSSQDSVLMNLYKRVYPRWTYDPYVPLPWIRREGAEKMDDMKME
ncbi:hypothetical protein AAFF_G00089020 [Aldrovandia affinis]|uniref:Pre-rRNA-processing protein TSR1 homolog n=1 Tax=Aldrovandia affinis TaxID=143900 RepID=A0AAD7RWG0_9TELE|nr:hypothetical protein AAFF_G00089020 [Aldrovandia affinis]